MKLILFCLVGTAAATSPATPIANDGKIDAYQDTHQWSANHISLAEDGANDHANHSAIFYGDGLQSDHGEDTRTLDGTGKNTEEKKKNSLPTRFETNKRADPKLECTQISCEHVARMYNNIQTSSIVVTHKCGAGAAVFTGTDTPSWGPRFSSSRTFAERNSTYKQLSAEAACEETVCTEGHVCGLSRGTSGTSANKDCKCHKLETAYDPTSYGVATAAPIAVDKSAVKYSTTAAAAPED